MPPPSRHLITFHVRPLSLIDTLGFVYRYCKWVSVWVGGWGGGVRDYRSFIIGSCVKNGAYGYKRKTDFKIMNLNI